MPAKKQEVTVKISMQERREMLELSRQFQKIARDTQSMLDLHAGIDPTGARHIGFALLVFTAPRASYISNCDRDEVINALKELLEHWEKGMEDIPAHKVQ